MAAAKKVFVYTDFDRTMIKDDSARILAKEMLLFYKKTFGWFFLPGQLAKTIYRFLLYKATGKTKHFYKAFFFFDDEALERVVQNLTLNPKWIAAIQDIQRKEGRDTPVEIVLTILSRNVVELIRRFVALPQTQAQLASLHCTLHEIIAHTDILVGAQTIITAGVWREGQSQPFIDARGLTTRQISRQELRKVSVLVLQPHKEYVAHIAETIERDKHFFFHHGFSSHAYYIGDEEEEYLLKEGIPAERFYRI